MISLDMKSEAKTAPSSPLSLSTPSDEPGLSFSELLRGVSEKKDNKIIQNGSLILSLDNEKTEIKDTKVIAKVDSLLSLLKGEEALPVEEPLALNPVLTDKLSIKDLKVLVADAKNYLKDKIEDSKDFKMSQIKELPKTLKGLVEVAKKFNIDISKITIEEVKVHAEVKNVRKDDIKVLSTKDALEKAPMAKEISDKNKPEASHVKELLNNREVKTPVIKEISSDRELKSQTQKLKEATQDKELKVQAPSLKDVTQDKEVKVQAPSLKEVTQDKEVKVQSSVTKEIKVETPILKEVSQDKDVKVKSQVIKTKDKDTKEETSIHKEAQKVQQNIDEKLIDVKKDVKATPLFKAQAVVEHTTTEQIVQVKHHLVEQKTPKDKANETLQLLLRGEKPSMSNPALTADFSVATAKVIASTATTDASRALENLLRGDSSPADDGIDILKTETAAINNDDGFEAKLKEAKQMIKYLSADVKTAIEDYKSPFTRVKVQLNPQKLGEVDLTVIQRGKNLHVTLTSNNSAINTLVMNASELKTQLNNSGINNATLNFNNSSQNGENAQQQQNNHQKHKEAQEEYRNLHKFANDEANEEILSSLEIVVPQYG